MINISIPRLIKKIKTPLLKLLSNIFSYIYRHKIIVGILFLFIFLVLTNLSDTINPIYRHMLIVGILFLIIFLAYREYRRVEFIIELFEVPEYVKKNGLTGKAIANKIKDKINYIRQEADTSMEAKQFSTKSVDPLPEIVVPGTGISIRPFIRYIKSEFSPYKQKIVTGELFVENDLLYLTTRVLDSPEKTFAPIKKEKLMEVSDSNKIGNFDNLMLEVAMHVYRYTQPYVLASYYYSLNKHDDAKEIVKEIVRDKNNADKTWAYNLWGIMLKDQKKNDEAIKMYNMALEEDADFEPAHYNLGNASYDEGDYSKAKEYYEKAIDLDPQYTDAYNNLGNVYNREGDYSKAKEYYEKAIDLDRKIVTAYFGLGLVYEAEKYDKGDTSKAKEMYEKVIEIDPNGLGKKAREKIENLPN